VHDLEPARLEQLYGDDTRERLAALIERDLAAETSAANIDALERLVRYQRDLVTLLRNFVTLSDFYAGERKAIFQAGTLYLDQRSCDLVLRVADMGKHAPSPPSAAVSWSTAPACAPGRPRSDRRCVDGRRGGRADDARPQWHLLRPGRARLAATVVKVVEQPVSIRQAFWSPYRRIGSFIEEQIRKFAAARDKDVESKASRPGSPTVTRQGRRRPGGGAPFDIAKFAGIFAAIGLAVGAIGTALAAAIGGLFTLAWWQLPLVFAGVMLAISGPSMLLAYMTLQAAQPRAPARRQRLGRERARAHQPALRWLADPGGRTA
jgi:hypothetical protein